MPVHLLDWIVFAKAQPQGDSGQLFSMLLMFGSVGVLFYFMLIRPQQRRERERKAMLAAIKKNDHVVTAGGIKGIVANVKPDEDEVVLRVDETTGAKLRVLLSSISRVVAAEGDAEPAKKDS